MMTLDNYTTRGVATTPPRAKFQIGSGLRPIKLWTGVLTVAMALIAAPLGAASSGGRGPRYCAQTADLVQKSCQAKSEEDFFIAMAKCLNVADAATRRQCEADAKAEKKDRRDSCREQLGARRDVCSLVGENRYDPVFDPAIFVDPTMIGNGVTPNSYFPIKPGTVWKYAGGGETVVVTVTNKTKLINGVTCLVVTDTVTVNGAVVEDTKDWFAQDLAGNVWYCGEEVKDFETFAGDNPNEPELVAIDGSFKAGRNGDKPGSIMLANPAPGIAYREEFSLGNAEDVAEILSVTENVPGFICNNQCLKTRNFTAIEPGVNEFKFYAPNVGFIFQVNSDGSQLQLVEFTAP